MCCFPCKIPGFFPKVNDGGKKKAPRLKPLNIQFKCWFHSPEHTLEAALLEFQPAPWLSPLVLVQASPTPCRANLCSVNRASVTSKLGCRPRAVRPFPATPE